MDVKCILLFALLIGLNCLLETRAQHEDIPYQDVENICKTCECLTAQDKRFHYRLSCAMKNFKNILARWPDEFGKNHNVDVDIVAIYSGNSIKLLQQLPATNASLMFSCRHCGIKQLQAPTFMDVPNIKRLDLSWNEITSDELVSIVFRGPYRVTHYEPIGLVDLDISHNNLLSLDRKLFEHTPNLTKLNLSHNKFSILDNPTTMALATAINLEILDLSHTAIKTLPKALLDNLVNLKVLNLAGNELSAIPDTLKLIGRSLEVLNLDGNKFQRFTEQSFVGLKVLKRLNMSDMPSLKFINNGTFAPLETLEYLHCSHNPYLGQFDFNSLMHCSNLTELDISYCSFSTVSLVTTATQTIGSNATNVTLPRPWPKLRIFETAGNVWLCDCELLQTLEYIGAHHQNKDIETRCDSPYIFSGAKLSNLTSERICSLHIPKKYRAIDEDPPRFLRKRYIILTIITASVVVVLGLLIGFIVVCIRRRLKRDDYGVEPIRYTSVRSSNLSAFSHVNTNGNTHA